MCGRGVDRHLFALYVVSLGLERESPFLRDALSVPWRLSTSQLPQRQEPLRWGDGVDDRENLSPSGGFGPVDSMGYGVSYMVAGSSTLFFHVCSKRSAAGTASQRMTNHIHKALGDMRALFDK